MAFTVPGAPWKLTAQDMGGIGGFDLGEAIKSGLGNYNLYQEAKFKPRELENREYGKELANKISEGKAKYAMQQALADLNYTNANTGHIGAQTRGLNIENKYLPEKLSLANQIQRIKSKYAEQRENAAIQKLLSGNRLTNEQANELHISNKTLPEKLKLALDAERFKAKYPLLNSTGVAGQIGALDYLQKNPESSGMQSTSSPQNSNQYHIPLEMELNDGRRTEQNPYEQYYESSLPSLGNKMKDMEEMHIPYDVLSNTLSEAFNNPNESRIPSIEKYFEEPDNSELYKIPMLMSIASKNRNNQDQQGLYNSQELSTTKNNGNQQNTNLSNMLRQSILSSLNPKSKSGSSPLGKLYEEYQQAQSGVYPGTMIPFRSQEEQQHVLNNYEDQIKSQIYGKGGKDAETIAANNELAKAKARRQNQLANEPILTPEQKAEQTATAKENVKIRGALEENIPQAMDELQRVNKAIKIAGNHPDWFGSPTPGLGLFTGASARKRGINNKAYGVLESTLEGLVGPKAKELSGTNKVLATSFGLAARMKPSLDENQKNALGKLNKVRDELLNSLRRYSAQYKEKGGKHDFFIPRTSFESKDEFHKYMQSLTPAQIQLVNNNIENKGI